MKFISWLINSLGRKQAAQDRVSVTDIDSNDVVDDDPFNPFPDPVRIDITDVFDLHTIQPRDVKRVIEEYLLLAHEARFRSVRIIHGKGIGVQREIVRSILAQTEFVRHWTDAPAEAGGWGATIVRLKQSADEADESEDHAE